MSDVESQRRRTCSCARACSRRVRARRPGRGGRLRGRGVDRRPTMRCRPSSWAPLAAWEPDALCAAEAARGLRRGGAPRAAAARTRRSSRTCGGPSPSIPRARRPCEALGRALERRRERRRPTRPAQRRTRAAAPRDPDAGRPGPRAPAQRRRCRPRRACARWARRSTQARRTPRRRRGSALRHAAARARDARGGGGAPRARAARPEAPAQRARHHVELARLYAGPLADERRADAAYVAALAADPTSEEAIAALRAARGRRDAGPGERGRARLEPVRGIAESLAGVTDEGERRARLAAGSAVPSLARTTGPTSRCLAAAAGCPRALGGRGRAGDGPRARRGDVAPRCRAVLLHVAAERALASGDAGAAVAWPSVRRRADEPARHRGPGRRRPGRVESPGRGGARASHRVVGPRAGWCAALADALDALGEAGASVGWSQRCVALRPGRSRGHRAAARSPLGPRATRGAWATRWPGCSLSRSRGAWLAASFARALRELAQLDADRAAVVARRRRSTCSGRIPSRCARRCWTWRSARRTRLRRGHPRALARRAAPRGPTARRSTRGWPSCGSGWVTKKSRGARGRAGHARGRRLARARRSPRAPGGPPAHARRPALAPAGAGASGSRRRATPTAGSWAWRELGGRTAGTLPTTARARSRRGGGRRRARSHGLHDAGARPRRVRRSRVRLRLDAAAHRDEADDARGRRHRGRRGARRAHRSARAGSRSTSPRAAVARCPSRADALEMAERAATAAERSGGAVGPLRARRRPRARAVRPPRGPLPGRPLLRAPRRARRLPSSTRRRRSTRCPPRARASSSSRGPPSAPAIARRPCRPSSKWPRAPSDRRRARRGCFAPRASPARARRGRAARWTCSCARRCRRPPSPSIALLRDAARDLLRYGPEERDGARDAPRARGRGPSPTGSTGPRGRAWRSPSPGRLSSCSRTPTARSTSLERAFACDADVDEYAELGSWAHGPGAREGRARPDARPSWRAPRRPHANIGVAALRLLAAVAAAVGDEALRARTVDRRGAREPDDDALVHRGRRGGARRARARRTPAEAGAASPARRGAARRSRARGSPTERARRGGAAVRARRRSRAAATSAPEVERELRAAWDAAGRGSEIEARVQREAASEGASPATRADHWTEIAERRESRGDQAGAVRALTEACKLDAEPLERWSALERRGRGWPATTRRGWRPSRPSRCASAHAVAWPCSSGSRAPTSGRAISRPPSAHGSGCWRSTRRTRRPTTPSRPSSSSAGRYDELADHLARRAERLSGQSEKKEMLRAVQAAARGHPRAAPRARGGCVRRALAAPGRVAEQRRGAPLLADLLERRGRSRQGGAAVAAGRGPRDRPSRSDELELRAGRAALRRRGHRGGPGARGAGARAAPAHASALELRVEIARAPGRRTEQLGDALEALAAGEAVDALTRRRPAPRGGAGGRARGGLRGARSNAPCAPPRRRPNGPRPSSSRAALEYRMRGAGAPDEARRTIEELARIRESLEGPTTRRCARSCWPRRSTSCRAGGRGCASSRRPSAPSAITRWSPWGSPSASPRWGRRAAAVDRYRVALRGRCSTCARRRASRSRGRSGPAGRASRRRGALPRARADRTRTRARQCAGAVRNSAALRVARRPALAPGRAGRRPRSWSCRR